MGWQQAGKLEPHEDSTFGGTPIDAEALAEIEKAVEAVCIARAKAAVGKLDLPTLLFLGVGVGNPGGAWHNPSGTERFDAASQISPPLLRDAIANGYFVVGLNFNVKGTPEPAALPAANGIHLHVPVRFPLGRNSTYCRKALDLLVSLAVDCRRVVVLNAVTDHLYPGLCELATVRTGMGIIGKKEGGILPTVLAVSYAETGAQRLIAPFAGIMSAVHEGATLTTVAEVFPTTEVFQ
ncbi:hypothetical protein F4553_006115 [Allocatelliglobosispora scoriae]|uniref:Uncharacterized protein n=1 Tax=Allocatelliglobosispora scoriae TaxID=643052 RepID=A0A841C1D5_9ACTN|nr:hypothetical protein [Allocatelliglobosispora scoriae]MBB5872681.1 hypothetical protein [Allocatelliglobosispora scoriae]